MESNIHNEVTGQFDPPPPTPPSPSESPCSTLSSYMPGGIPAPLIRSRAWILPGNKADGGAEGVSPASQGHAGPGRVSTYIPCPFLTPCGSSLSHFHSVSQRTHLTSPSKWIPPHGYLNSLSHCHPTQQPLPWSLFSPLPLQSALYATTRHIFHNVSQTRAPSVFYSQPSMGPFLPWGHSWSYFGPHRLA